MIYNECGCRYTVYIYSPSIYIVGQLQATELKLPLASLSVSHSWIPYRGNNWAVLGPFPCQGYPFHSSSAWASPSIPLLPGLPLLFLSCQGYSFHSSPARAIPFIPLLPGLSLPFLSCQGYPYHSFPDRATPFIPLLPGLPLSFLSCQGYPFHSSSARVIPTIPVRMNYHFFRCE